MLKKIKALIIAISILCLFNACGKAPDDFKIPKSTSTTAPNEDEPVELTFWTWFSISNTIKQFESENNNIKIKEQLFNYGECEEQFLEAFANGNGPDVLFFSSAFFNQFTTAGTLQNLLEEPFEVEKYKKDLLGWESCLSIDGEQLLAFTLSTVPYVTLYRADIMEENGFPFAPEEFGKFIEQPENLLAIAKKLYEQGRYIFEYPTDYTEMACATSGYFDNHLNFVKYDDLFIKTFDLEREAYGDKLFFRKSFWDAEGKKAVIDNKLVMHIGGSQTVSTLASYAPEQAGKWRMTKAPLGITAWGDDTRVSANAQSQHKEEAWKFMEFLLTYKYGTANQDSVEGYTPIHEHAKSLNRTHSFLGEQEIYPMIQSLATEMTQYKLTPLDKDARQIFSHCIWNNLDNINSQAVLKQIYSELETQLHESIVLLKK